MINKIKQFLYKKNQAILYLVDEVFAILYLFYYRNIL